VLEQVLDAYREGDLDECIRLVRTLVEAAAQATAPRQLLASLFAATGNGRQALAHYRRLLPQAVARGEVIRSIAFQKQIDVYEPPEGLPPGRWPSLQKQLREKGLPFIAEAPGGVERPWTESQLLALPRAWFERIAAETRFEIIGLEPRALDAEAGTVWEVLAGRMRWSYALPDGRASVESLAAEGDAVHVDPGLARTARVSLVPELPVEALRFEAGLARDLRLALTAGLHVTGAGASGLTPEARALLPIRPRRREDFDDVPAAPLPNAGIEPLQLPPPSEEPEAAPVGGDGAGWVEFGVLSLSEPPAEDLPAIPERDRVIDLPPPAEEPVAAVAGSVDDGSTAAPEREGDVAPAPEDEVSPPELEIVPPAEIPSAGEAIPLAASDTPDPVDPFEALMALSAAEPFGAPIGDGEPTIERRRHPRVMVSLASRIALLRLSGTSVSPVEGQLSDLSTSGFSIRFTHKQLGASRAALADAVVAVDMDLPGPSGALRMAAQVRWLGEDQPGDEVRLGIEFVLLTEPDRRRIAGTLARAALAARDQERKAA
jgi:hypothetical protein